MAKVRPSEGLVAAMVDVLWAARELERDELVVALGVVGERRKQPKVERVGVLVRGGAQERDVQDIEVRVRLAQEQQSSKIR